MHKSNSHSIEAEQSVPGGLLLDNSAWDRAGDPFTDSDFYRWEHRHIYAAIGALVNATGCRRDHCPSSCRATAGRGVRRPCSPQRAPAERERGQPVAVRGDRARARHPGLVATSDEIATAAFNPQGRQVSGILERDRRQDLRIARGSRSKQGSRSIGLSWWCS